MKLVVSLVLSAFAVFASESIATRSVATIDPNPPLEEPTTTTPATKGAFILRYEVAFSPDKAMYADADAFRVSLSYTDLDGVAHVETRTADKADKISVLFTPKPFLFGTVKITPLISAQPVSIPVVNTAFISPSGN